MDQPSANLWHDTCREDFTSSALEGVLDVDLVIIGGGYCGLSAALQAASKGLSVAVLEGETVGHGGSGRNVGLCNAGLWLPPEQINKRLGDTIGSRLTRVLGEAPDIVFDLIDRHKIECEPVRKGTLHCAHSPRGFSELKDRFRQLDAVGAPVELLDEEESQKRVGSKRVFGALFDPRAGTIQPMAYARGLARAASSAGAHILEKTPALSIGWENGKWDVATPKGMVAAKTLIQATNAYSHNHSWIKHPRLVNVHYFQAATDPLPEDLRKGILDRGEGCWDTATVMSSWRLDQSGRLIIGAMGQLDQFASLAHVQWLLRKTKRMFPQLAGQKFQHLWHGKIGMTREYHPQIQRLGPNGYGCFGFSGRGIGPGTLFGKAIADALINGDEEGLPIVPINEYSQPFPGLKTLFYEAGATVTHMAKDRH